MTAFADVLGTLRCTPLWRLDCAREPRGLASALVAAGGGRQQLALNAGPLVASGTCSESKQLSVGKLKRPGMTVLRTAPTTAGTMSSSAATSSAVTPSATR